MYPVLARKSNMAGAISTRQSSRKRAKATTEQPQSRTDLPPYTFGGQYKETVAGRNRQQQTGAPLKHSKDKISSTRAPTTPAAKKNLQKLFEDSSSKDKLTTWDLTDHLFSRIFLLLIAAAGISSTLWSLKDGHWGHSDLPEVPTVGKISEIEDFLRKTSKWMQVQLDLVDDKIGNEVSGVRLEMEDKMNQKSLGLESEVRRLQAQVHTVDDSLRTLYSEDLLSKEETLELIKSALEKRAEEGGDQALSLDDVRAAARKLVQDELEVHAADGIGRVDYALESGGGKVIYHSDGYFQGLHWTRLGIHVVPGVFRKHPTANAIIKPSFGEPGQCLPLKGSNVLVDIRLRSHILPEAVTLEHLSKKVAYDARSAPKDFRIFGWSENSSSVNLSDNMSFLGEFTYNLDKGSIQTFDLSRSNAIPGPVNMIRLHVLSNYGSPTHTCLYRLRVHGSEQNPNLEIP